MSLGSFLTFESLWRPVLFSRVTRSGSFVSVNAECNFSWASVQWFIHPLLLPCLIWVIWSERCWNIKQEMLQIWCGASEEQSTNHRVGCWSVTLLQSHDSALRNKNWEPSFKDESWQLWKQSWLTFQSFPNGAPWKPWISRLIFSYRLHLINFSVNEFKLSICILFKFDLSTDRNTIFYNSRVYSVL